MIIHRYWSGDAALPVTSSTARFIAEQDLKAHVLDWTDENLPQEILDHVTTVEDYVPESDRMRHRSNVIRLMLLQRFGGVWMDHDFVLFFSPSVGITPTVASYSVSEMMCSCYMEFPAHHHLLEKALAEVHPDVSSPRASGGTLLDKVFGDEVNRVPLPYTRTRVNGGKMWGIHFFGTTGKDD